MKAITILFILFLAVSLGGTLTSISVLSSLPALADHHEAEEAAPAPDEPTASPSPDAPDAELPGGDMPDEAAGDEAPADQGY